jgi:hypothetical protein
VHVAHHGAKAGSSSDRGMAGDGLQAHVSALYKAIKKTLKRAVRLRSANIVFQFQFIA